MYLARSCHRPAIMPTMTSLFAFAAPGLRAAASFNAAFCSVIAVRLSLKSLVIKGIHQAHKLNYKEESVRKSHHPLQRNWRSGNSLWVE